jgi:flavin reductase (DIM6/NTAB) family NADH-FMN oxidoreductase RutF
MKAAEGSPENGAAPPLPDPAFEPGSLAAVVPHPMVVATTAAGDDRAGCLVGFHTRCSIEPPRYLVCLSTANRTFEVASRAEVMIVHYPPSDRLELARHFGEETGHEVDKFAGLPWSVGPGGAPLLDAIDTWFAGRIIGSVDLGDHRGFVLEPFAGRAADPIEPLDSRTASWFEAGHRVH